MEALTLGWIVGLFEGEGCIVRPYPRHGSTANLTLTDRATIIKFWKSVKVGTVYGPYWDGLKSHKPYYKWYVFRKQEVEKFLRLISPYLSKRRKAAAIKNLHFIKRMKGRWPQ